MNLSGRLCLTVKQPWAWLIIHGGKDIENRDWPTNVRGRILIHASKGMTKNDYESACYASYGYISKPIPLFGGLDRGGIIGSVEIVDCVSRSNSPWFFGKYGFELRDPKPLPFYPCKGQLGFWRLEGDR